MQVIACGNRFRQDDAAGPLVADRLRALGIPVALCSGDAIELVETWKGAVDVILVDAVVTGAPAGTVHVWDGDLPSFALRVDTSTHGLGVAQAIRLAVDLWGQPPHLRIYGIEAAGFDMGAAPSAAVAAAADEVAARIAAALGSASA